MELVEQVVPAPADLWLVELWEVGESLGEVCSCETLVTLHFVQYVGILNTDGFQVSV